jgi:hypothetical protein
MVIELSHRPGFWCGTGVSANAKPGAMTVMPTTATIFETRIVKSPHEIR